MTISPSNPTTPRGGKAIREAIDALPISDLGIAQRFILEHGHEIRYVPEWKTWVIWNGRQWRRDKRGEISLATARAVSLARSPERSRRVDAGAVPTRLG